MEAFKELCQVLESAEKRMTGLGSLSHWTFLYLVN